MGDGDVGREKGSCGGAGGQRGGAIMRKSTLLDERDQGPQQGAN